MDQAVAERHTIDLPFRRIAPDGLGAIWSWVERGLNVVRAVSAHKPWGADDVLRRLVDERAHLYVREDAFVVLEKCVEPISERPYLNVWVMWSEPQKANQIRPAIVRWLYAQKAAQGCDWWQFSSPRPGWYGIEAGCEPVYTVWRSR